MGTREAESVPADSAFKLDDLEAEYDLYKANEQLEDNEVTVNGSEDDYGNKKGIDLVKETEVRYYGSPGPEAIGGNIPGFEESTVSVKDYYNQFIREKLTLNSAGSSVYSLFPIVKWFPH